MMDWIDSLNDQKRRMYISLIENSKFLNQRRETNEINSEIKIFAFPTDVQYINIQVLIK